MKVVAHRFGNTKDSLLGIQDSVDLVEVDVHRGRKGRLEVRHAKILWPTKRLWEKWYLLAPNTKVPLLQNILEAAGPRTHLWLDLKGPDPRLGHDVIVELAGRRPVTVSSKAWWVLKPFIELAGVTTFRSAGNRIELALVLWLPSRTNVDGTVVHHRLLTSTIAERLLKRGAVYAWGADDRQSVRRLIDLGIDGVILDDPVLAPRN